MCIILKFKNFKDKNNQDYKEGVEADHVKGNRKKEQLLNSKKKTLDIKRH